MTSIAKPIMAEPAGASSGENQDDGLESLGPEQLRERCRQLQHELDQKVDHLKQLEGVATEEHAFFSDELNNAEQSLNEEKEKCSELKKKLQRLHADNTDLQTENDNLRQELTRSTTQANRRPSDQSEPASPTSANEASPNNAVMQAVEGALWRYVHNSEEGADGLQRLYLDMLKDIEGAAYGQICRTLRESLSGNMPRYENECNKDYLSRLLDVVLSSNGNSNDDYNVKLPPDNTEPTQRTIYNAIENSDRLEDGQKKLYLRRCFPYLYYTYNTLEGLGQSISNCMDGILNFGWYPDDDPVVFGTQTSYEILMTTSHGADTAAERTVSRIHMKEDHAFVDFLNRIQIDHSTTKKWDQVPVIWTKPKNASSTDDRDQMTFVVVAAEEMINYVQAYKWVEEHQSLLNVLDSGTGRNPSEVKGNWPEKCTVVSENAKQPIKTRTQKVLNQRDALRPPFEKVPEAFKSFLNYIDAKTPRFNQPHIPTLLDTMLALDVVHIDALHRSRAGKETHLSSITVSGQDAFNSVFGDWKRSFDYLSSIYQTIEGPSNTTATVEPNAHDYLLNVGPGVIASMADALETSNELNKRSVRELGIRIPRYDTEKTMQGVNDLLEYAKNAIGLVDPLFNENSDQLSLFQWLFEIRASFDAIMQRYRRQHNRGGTEFEHALTTTFNIIQENQAVWYDNDSSHRIEMTHLANERLSRVATADIYCSLTYASLRGNRDRHDSNSKTYLVKAVEFADVFLRTLRVEQDAITTTLTKERARETGLLSKNKAKLNQKMRAVVDNTTLNDEKETWANLLEAVSDVLKLNPSTDLTMSTEEDGNDQLNHNSIVSTLVDLAKRVFVENICQILKDASINERATKFYQGVVTTIDQACKNMNATRNKIKNIHTMSSDATSSLGAILFGNLVIVSDALIHDNAQNQNDAYQSIQDFYQRHADSGDDANIADLLKLEQDAIMTFPDVFSFVKHVIEYVPKSHPLHGQAERFSDTLNLAQEGARTIETIRDAWDLRGTPGQLGSFVSRWSRLGHEWKSKTSNSRNIPQLDRLFHVLSDDFLKQLLNVDGEHFQRLKSEIHQIQRFDAHMNSVMDRRNNDSGIDTMLQMLTSNEKALEPYLNILQTMNIESQSQGLSAHRDYAEVISTHIIEMFQGLDTFSTSSIAKTFKDRFGVFSVLGEQLHTPVKEIAGNIKQHQDQCSDHLAIVLCKLMSDGFGWRQAISIDQGNPEIMETSIAGDIGTVLQGSRLTGSDITTNAVSWWTPLRYLRSLRFVTRQIAIGVAHFTGGDITARNAKQYVDHLRLHLGKAFRDQSMAMYMSPSLYLNGNTIHLDTLKNKFEQWGRLLEAWTNLSQDQILPGIPKNDESGDGLGDLGNFFKTLNDNKTIPQTGPPQDLFGPVMDWIKQIVHIRVGAREFFEYAGEKSALLDDFKGALKRDVAFVHTVQTFYDSSNRLSFDQMIGHLQSTMESLFRDLPSTRNIPANLASFFELTKTTVRAVQDHMGRTTLENQQEMIQRMMELVVRDLPGADDIRSLLTLFGRLNTLNQRQTNGNALLTRLMDWLRHLVTACGNDEVAISGCILQAAQLYQNHKQMAPSAVNASPLVWLETVQGMVINNNQHGQGLLLPSHNDWTRRVETIKTTCMDNQELLKELMPSNLLDTRGSVAHLKVGTKAIQDILNTVDRHHPIPNSGNGQAPGLTDDHDIHDYIERLQNRMGVFKQKTAERIFTETDIQACEVALSGLEISPNIRVLTTILRNMTNTIPSFFEHALHATDEFVNANGDLKQLGTRLKEYLEQAIAMTPGNPPTVADQMTVEVDGESSNVIREQTVSLSSAIVDRHVQTREFKQQFQQTVQLSSTEIKRYGIPISPTNKPGFEVSLNRIAAINILTRSHNHTTCQHTPGRALWFCLVLAAVAHDAVLREQVQAQRLFNRWERRQQQRRQTMALALHVLGHHNKKDLYRYFGVIDQFETVKRSFDVRGYVEYHVILQLGYVGFTTQTQRQKDLLNHGHAHATFYASELAAWALNRCYIDDAPGPKAFAEQWIQHQDILVQGEVAIRELDWTIQRNWAVVAALNTGWERNDILEWIASIPVVTEQPDCRDTAANHLETLLPYLLWLATNMRLLWASRGRISVLSGLVPVGIDLDAVRRADEDLKSLCQTSLMILVRQRTHQHTGDVPTLYLHTTAGETVYQLTEWQQTLIIALQTCVGVYLHLQSPPDGFDQLSTMFGEADDADLLPSDIMGSPIDTLHSFPLLPQWSIHVSDIQQTVIGVFRAYSLLDAGQRPSGWHDSYALNAVWRQGLAFLSDWHKLLLCVIVADGNLQGFVHLVRTYLRAANVEERLETGQTISPTVFVQALAQQRLWRTLTPQHVPATKHIQTLYQQVSNSQAHLMTTRRCLQAQGNHVFDVNGRHWEWLLYPLPAVTFHGQSRQLVLGSTQFILHDVDRRPSEDGLIWARLCAVYLQAGAIEPSDALVKTLIYHGPSLGPLAASVVKWSRILPLTRDTLSWLATVKQWEPVPTEVSEAARATVLFNSVNPADINTTSAFVSIAPQHLFKLETSSTLKTPLTIALLTAHAALGNISTTIASYRQNAYWHDACDLDRQQTPVVMASAILLLHWQKRPQDRDRLIQACKHNEPLRGRVYDLLHETLYGSNSFDRSTYRHVCKVLNLECHDRVLM